MTPPTDFRTTLATLNTKFSTRSLQFNRGIERESLRVDNNGNLAQTPHPASLGAKLCHPTITTDFSEAQLELITPVSQSVEDTLTRLNDIHRFVYSQLGEEILWSASMPCVLQGDRNIPLAQYGNSNLGRLKTTYRNGLGNRYGRLMQTICAVHYNFSFGEEFWRDLAKFTNTPDTQTWRSKRYFDVMRNFRRFSWLVIYLTGASPAVCNSFVKRREHNLQRFDDGSLFSPGATSLRNGNLGYQSDTQSELINICYTSLEDYVRTLTKAVLTPFAHYTQIGTRREAEHLQINDCILQSEAEFYTTIRAKRVPPKGENFLKCLLQDGVEYVEVRLLDVNPYHPMGIDADTVNLLDTLLLYCVLIESPIHDDDLCNSVGANVVEVVHRGRQIETRLNDQGTSRSISEWGGEILDELLLLAARQDEINNSDCFMRNIETQKRKLRDPNLTPSGQILTDMRSESIPFFRFAMNKSLVHKQYFLDQPLSKAEMNNHKLSVKKSFADQNRIQQADALDFDTYLNALQQEYQALLKVID